MLRYGRRPYRRVGSRLDGGLIKRRSPAELSLPAGLPMSLLHGAPPKVLWLRIGSGTTTDIVRLLAEHADDVRQFEAQSDATVLELG